MLMTVKTHRHHSPVSRRMRSDVAKATKVNYSNLSRNKRTPLTTYAIVRRKIR